MAKGRGHHPRAHAPETEFLMTPYQEYHHPLTPNMNINVVYNNNNNLAIAIVTTTTTTIMINNNDNILTPH